MEHGRYPTIHDQYHRLIDHPREGSVEYRQAATKGSTLIPLLSIWTSSLNRRKASESLANFSRKHLKHCNKQLWLPGADSEERLYKGDVQHGVALNDIPITADGTAAMEILDAECAKNAQGSFASMSAIRLGHWPIFVMACRHYRLPIPPNMWFSLLRSRRNSAQSD